MADMNIKMGKMKSIQNQDEFDKVVKKLNSNRKKLPPNSKMVVCILEYVITI
jgi:hypothetical protein